MKTLSVEAKKAYFSKTRRSNYLASLQLEGFSVERSDVSSRLPTREVLVKRYSKVKCIGDEIRG